uniref:G-protein coupled receptors family 1 profile domain-containing protein n=1 Tax=Octopus bimaculoides TaxID=37653 RepID=A0A0L8II40_OCTBM
MCSSWLNVVISIERMLAVYIPILQRFFSKVYTPYCVIFVVFVVVYITYTLFKIYVTNMRHYYIAVVSMYSFIPSVFLIVSSVAIIYKIVKRPKIGQQISRNLSPQLLNSVRIVIAIDAVFLLTTFPTSIYHSVVIVHIRKEISQNIVFLFNTLVLINNSLNFIAYIIASKTFRRNLKQICCRKKKIQRQSVYTLQRRHN